MANFNYTARDKSGNITKAVIEANDKSTVVTMLKNKGLVPLDVKEKSGFRGKSKLALNKKVSLKDISVFCRQFSAVIDAGIPVLECVDIIRKQTESVKIREILNKVFEQVQKGRTLSDSFKEFKDILPGLMINMIEAGEASGTLDKVMARLAVYFANSNRLRSKAVSAMVYPLFIFVFAIIAVIVLMIYVVPKFKDLYGSMGAELPWITTTMLSVSNFLTSHFILLIVLLLGAIIGLIYFASSQKGKEFFDRTFLKIPVISDLMRKMIAATFTRTMASLLNAGVPLIQCLEITDRVINNTVMEGHLAKVREDVTKGSKLSVALSFVKVFPIMVVNMTNIGEESGSLDAILDKTADFFEEEADAAITRATTMIEPLAIAFMAMVVGVVVMGVVSPMANMFETMQNMK